MLEISEWKEMKDRNYGQKVVVFDYDGIIDFDPDKVKDIVGGEKLSYDEYLEIAVNSMKDVKHGFQRCFYEGCYCRFKGRIEKMNSKNVCFEKIYIDAMSYDASFFEDVEEHVWMSKSGFSEFKVGDSVSFSAEAYRYLKTSNGKKIDFGLRNPTTIKKISSYELPSEDYLLKQELDRVVCEACIFYDTCDGINCMADAKWRVEIKNSMFNAIKGNENEKK